MAVSEVWIALHQFSQKAQSLIVCGQPVPNFIKIEGIIFFNPLCKVYISLHRFSRNLQVLNHIIYICPVPILILSVEKYWNYVQKFVDGLV
jgi:hypothetical protein